jgi:hypothetical protein
VDGFRRRAHRDREDPALAAYRTYGTAAVLLVLGVLILTSPHAIPWLTLPDEQSMPMMTSDAP